MNKKTRKLREKFEEENGFEERHRDMDIYKEAWKKFKRGLRK